MGEIRKPFQGVFNIIRFNWHFYAIALITIGVIIFSTAFIAKPYHPYAIGLGLFIVSSIASSLLASLYVYDISGFYKLDWVEKDDNERTIVTINAGFDETSHLLQLKFPKANLIALDFYNPVKHTEVSIKRARKAYPPFPNTKEVRTFNLGLSENSIDKLFVILSAHEIRNNTERIAFLRN